MASDGYKNGGGEEILPVMVNVTAPSTLPAGYTFEAYLNDDKNRPFTCEVVRTSLFCITFRKSIHPSVRVRSYSIGQTHENI